MNVGTVCEHSSRCHDLDDLFVRVPRRHDLLTLFHHHLQKKNPDAGTISRIDSSTKHHPLLSCTEPVSVHVALDLLILVDSS